MNIDHLVQMANQIATFFESQSSADAAIVETASHLRKFWEPRMRREIIAHLDGETRLTPVARGAVESLARQSTVTATSA